jgi:hypothetical protein
VVKKNPSIFLLVTGGLIADGDHQPVAKSANTSNEDRQLRKIAAYNTVFML